MGNVFRTLIRLYSVIVVAYGFALCVQVSAEDYAHYCSLAGLIRFALYVCFIS